MLKIFLSLFLFVWFAFSLVAQTKMPEDVQALVKKHACVGCHQTISKTVGPSWKDIAKKEYSEKQFAALVAKPVPANWPGYPPMAPLPAVPKADLKKISAWVATLKD